MIKDLRIMQAVVDMAVGIPKFSYQMNRNQPMPTTDFAAIKLVETVNPGYDKQELILDPFGDLIQRSTGVRVLKFDILFSRDDTEIDVFNNSFYRYDIREYLDTQGYALMSRLPIRIKDTKFETDWIIRSGVTVTMSTIRVEDTPIKEIRTVEINGEYVEGDTTIKLDPIIVGDEIK